MSPPIPRFVSDPQSLQDQLFFVEEDRTTRADNTFSFKTKRFEAPRHLPDRVIQIRFERRRPSDRVVVYCKGERMGEAHPLDPVANDRKPLPPRPPLEADGPTLPIQP